MSAAALKKFQDKFAKSFGERVGLQKPEIKPYEVISTGSVSLDFATGVGGYVEGRLHEVWGPESIGKTTLCLLGIVEAQKKYPSKHCVFVDMEQTFDPKWAKMLGVDLERVLLITPKSSEDVADALKDALESGLFSFVVVDSIGAMIPKKEKDKKAEDADVGTQAKLVTRMVKIAAVEAARTGTVVVFINQVRANIAYGADITTGGGYLLKHATTLKFRLSRTREQPLKIKVEGVDIPVGVEIKVLLERNKVSPRGTAASYWLLTQDTQYGPVGIDKADEAAILGLRPDVAAIIQGGAYYTIVSTGEKVKSRASLIELLRSTPALVESIRAQALKTREDFIIPSELSDLRQDDEEESDESQ